MILGGAGHDFIKGEGGQDTIFGGNGNDRINGGEGADQIQFGNGAGEEKALFDEAFAEYSSDLSDQAILTTDTNGAEADIQPLLNGERTLYLENLAFLGNRDITADEAAELVHGAFLDSPSHFGNLTNAQNTEIGIGIFKNANGWYVVHSFFVS